MLTRLHLAWRLYRDPRVAPRMKVVLPVLALLYLISPIDAIPDVLLGPGQLDDLTVITLVVVALGRLAKWAPVAVVEEHLARLGKRRGRGRASAANDIFDARYHIVDKS
jgi:uncharacterized membrane protein YkvA (DUF1232 family)